MSNKPLPTKKPFDNTERNSYIIEIPQNGGSVTISNVTKLWVNDAGVAIFFEENNKVKYACPCECYDSIRLKESKDILTVSVSNRIND